MTENKDNSQKPKNVNKFFENEPKMAMKIKETKSAKKKREAAELASQSEGEDRHDDVISEHSEVDGQNFSDWEVPKNPFIQSYLEGDSDVGSEKKIKVKKRPEQNEMKTSKGIEGDTDEESPSTFQHDIEKPKTIQVYKPSAKKGHQKTDSTIFEPLRGKGSFGRFEAYLEERKMRHITSMAQRGHRVKPDFQVMDPGDGEDEYGADRMLEPPPEAVVVPTVPYGFKKVVAEDGTVTYTQPDITYEKAIMTNYGYVITESMDEEEVEDYIRQEKINEELWLKEEKEKKERRLLNLPELSEDEEFSEYKSTSDDYDVTWEEFENSKYVNTHPVYGIPTNYNPYGRNLDEEGYLSDADEKKRISTRSTAKKDLKLLGDVVQAFRIENPDKDDEFTDFFENINTKTVPEQFSVHKTTTTNEENIDKSYDDDYNDGIQEGIESTDEYDDDVADVDLVLKDRGAEPINFATRDFITDGLLKVELKRKDGFLNSEEFSQGFELVLEGEDNNYDDDQAKEDFEDGLNDVSLIENTVAKFDKMNIRNDSDEDIDLSDESESYDSEEDDYEDIVKEEDYNDGIRLSDMENSQDADEEMDSDDEFDQLFEEETPKQKVQKIREETEFIDPNFFSESSEREDINNETENEYRSEEDEDDEDDEDYDDDEDDNELWDESFLVISSSESSDYDPEGGSQYGDLSSLSLSEEAIEQDYNPADILEELELQGDTFDDFEYSIDNATWIDFPYKHAGDAVEEGHVRREPGKELPYWYYIKHPAEDDSLMNIRAKLADHYDNQYGPYNPFKVNPPPKPSWVDDRFDLVPEGVQVPDDFFPGFMKPDPETWPEEDDDGDDDDDDDDGDHMEYDDFEEVEDADGRSWRQLDTGEIPRRRTWKSWRSRPEDEPSRPINERWNTGLRDPLVNQTQAQKAPKKNDQWQHYRDWLLRQGSKSVAKNSQTSQDTNNREHLKSDDPVPEGRFSGKKITIRREEKTQPRPHYQTWLTKQVGFKDDTTTNVTEDSKVNKPNEMQKTIHKNFEKAFVGDTRSEVMQRPSENMWQHYQKWKQKDTTHTTKTNSISEENVDYFVFSKPPTDNNNPKGSPYSAKEVDVPKNNDSEHSKNELSGLDLMKKSHNLDKHIDSKEPSPKRSNGTIDNNSTTSDKSSHFSALQNNFQGETYHRRNNWDSRHNSYDKPDPVSSYSSSVSPQPVNPGPETPGSSRSYNNTGLDGRYTPNMSSNITPRYSSKQMFNISYENETSSLLKNKSLKRSSHRTSILLSIPRNVQPKLKQKKAFVKIQPLHSPINILELDSNLNLKNIDQVGTTDNFTLDISRPREVLKNIPDLSSVISRSSREPLNLFNGPKLNVSTGRVINMSNVDVNQKNTMENENKATTTGESKPKRKYTKRKQSDLNSSKETPATGSPSGNIVSKRKYTRRAKTFPEESNIASLIKTDDSSLELCSQTNKQIIQNDAQGLSNSVTKETEPHASSSSGTIPVTMNTNETTNDFDTNESSTVSSTKTKFVDILEKKELKNDAIEQNLNDNTVTPCSSLKEGKPLLTPEAVNTPEVIPNIFTTESNYKKKAEKKSNTLNTKLFQNHFQNYQTYVERQVNEHPIDIAQSPRSNYISKPSPSSIDPGKTSQPTPHQSRVYPVIQPKQYGDHWFHYTTWLENNGIKKQLYKTPISRPVIYPGRPSPTDLNVGPVPETVKINLETTVSTVGEAAANHMTDEKVEYLHQRWLAWQQNLASKMVNKLNKMLKYYENPEGNITQDTVMVGNMIKQRDYWREIHRWSSRKGFSLYNKTPPQTDPATLNLTEPHKLRLRPQWPGKDETRTYFKYNSEESLETKEFENYKHWSAPDSEVIITQPTTPTTEFKTEQMEFMKKQEETKSSKLPVHLETKEEIKRPRFPDQGYMRSYQEPVEGSKRPKFPDVEPVRSYQGPIEGSTRPKFPDYRSIKHYSEHKEGGKMPQLPDQVTKQGMTYGGINQDKFFKDISDLLGQSVLIGEKVKESKSRSLKHLERRQKAKYKEEKKEKINQKKNGEYLIKMDQYGLDTSSDDEKKEQETNSG